MMARSDLSQYDASSRAASELEYVIKREKRAGEGAAAVPAEQAMKDRRQYEVSSSRNVTRVLFISQDTELLNPTQQTLDGYINISDLFDEVHILILREGIPPKNPVLRAAHNVWIYTAASRGWWQMAAAGVAMASAQLQFAAGFRPDLIVARDPFESARVAHILGAQYNRPTQLHVLEDYTTKAFAKKNHHNFFRRFLPQFTIPKFSSVRTQTATIERIVKEKYSIADIAILPKYQDYEALIDKEVSYNLKATFKPIIFFLLYIGQLGHNSTVHKAIDAARFVLKNRRVGMLVIGDGPARGEFVKRTKTLGIDSQVVFLPQVIDVVPYLKSANMLLVTDTDQASEEIVLQGAASGIPIVMRRTEKREDIFIHGESAFMFDQTNLQMCTDGINTLLNDIDLREQFVAAGQQVIRDKFHSDPSEYLEAFRNSIEEAFFVDTDVRES